MEPGELLARGRDADVFAFGDGLVLRRARNGRSLAHEARVMELVAAHGFPVPAVREVRAGGTEIVMERIDGPLMMTQMAKQPWAIARHATALADLHDRLHEIQAPGWLRQWDGDEDDRLLHLDLHPLNVIVSARGPVVIDWANAARGDPLSDVALAYVLLVAPRMPAPRLVRVLAQPARLVLARLFARRYRSDELWSHIASAAERKAHDRNMLPDEVERLRRLARRMRARER